MKKLAIIGAGDLGKLVAHHALDAEFEVVGYFDDTIEKGKIIQNHTVLGEIDSIEDAYRNGIFDCLFIAIGYKHLDFRWKLFSIWKGRIPMARIIHSSAYLDPTVEVGEGCFVLPGCVLDKGVKLGDNVILNTGCVVAHDSVIGSNSFLGPGVTLAGFISIGESCFIGVGTTIIDNVTLKNHIQTGGGSVVTKSLEKQGLYVGVPARFIR